MKEEGLLSVAHKFDVTVFADRIVWNGTSCGSVPLNEQTSVQLLPGNGSHGKLLVANGATKILFYPEPGPPHLQEDMNMWFMTVEQCCRSAGVSGLGGGQSTC